MLRQVWHHSAQASTNSAFFSLRARASAPSTSSFMKLMAPSADMATGPASPEGAPVVATGALAVPELGEAGTSGSTVGSERAGLPAHAVAASASGSARRIDMPEL